MTTKATVRTRAELVKAKRDRIVEIHVVGPLADRLQSSKKVACLGAGGVAVLLATAGGLVAAVPALLGFPFVPILSAGVWTAIEIGAVVGATSLSAALLLAVYVGYDEIDAGPETLKLRRMTRR